MAPGVGTRALDGWTAVHVRRSEGKAWLRARLAQELAFETAGAPSAPTDVQP